MSVFDQDRWRLSSLQSERYEAVPRHVRGRTLDLGCGPHDRFVREFLGGNGVGLDVFPYPGLRPDQIVKDMTQLPFDDESFDTVTFIANLNHVPRNERVRELTEARRVLRQGGNLVATMALPWAEIAAHRAVHTYDKLFGTQHDVDTTRGMSDEEDLFVKPRELRRLLGAAGFVDVARTPLWTQWGLNWVYVAWKLAGTPRGPKPT